MRYAKSLALSFAIAGFSFSALPAFSADSAKSANSGWIESDPAQFNRDNSIERSSQNQNHKNHHNQPPVQTMHMTDVRSPEKETQETSLSQKAVAVPKSVAGAMAGVTIGVPVKVCKSIGHYSKSMHRSMKDGIGVEEDEIDLAGRSISAFCSYPFGVLSGVIHGTIKGVERGIEAGSKRPFSKESFSLTDPKKETASKY